jgi:hypothetical protein
MAGAVRGLTRTYKEGIELNMELSLDPNLDLNLDLLLLATTGPI